MLAAEALAHGDMGLAVAALAPAAVATALGLWGDGDQQATYLPAFVGEDVPAARRSRSRSRARCSTRSTLKTTARRDGDDFVLDGVKALVPRAEAAELLIVGARLEGHGPALFLVEPSSDGVLRRRRRPRWACAPPPPATCCSRASGSRRARCSATATRPSTPSASAVARLAWCALALGTARAVLDYVIPYVNEREAFGEPISHRQAVAFMVADIAIELEGMRLATCAPPLGSTPARTAAREVALARELCAEKGMQIGSDGVQLLGGHGFVKEHPVERWYRDLRAVGVCEGAVLV